MRDEMYVRSDVRLQCFTPQWVQLSLLSVIGAAAVAPAVNVLIEPQKRGRRGRKVWPHVRLVGSIFPPAEPALVALIPVTIACRAPHCVGEEGARFVPPAALLTLPAYRPSYVTPQLVEAAIRVGEERLALNHVQILRAEQCRVGRGGRRWF